MFNKTISFLLITLLINCACLQLAAATGGEKGNTRKEAKIRKRGAEIKEGVMKLGVSTDSRVKVKLRDKTKISGYISSIEDDNFTVVDKSGQTHVIEYEKAKQIKGNNLHAGVWIAIGVGIAFVVIGVVMTILLSSEDA